MIHSDQVVSRRQKCMKEVDQRLGITGTSYSRLWWAIGIWNACATFNIWSRTQQWGFAIPLAPDFEKFGSSYGVAAIGALAGSVFLWYILLSFHFYVSRWGRCSVDRSGRIPAVGFISVHHGRLTATILCISLVVVIAFPLAAQVHFVDKFLSGGSELIKDGLFANNCKRRSQATALRSCFR
jgi:hypothetical protein